MHTKQRIVMLAIWQKHADARLSRALIPSNPFFGNENIVHLYAVFFCAWQDSAYNISMHAI